MKRTRPIRASQEAMRRILLLLTACSGLYAQDYYPRHNFTLGAGAALPRGDLGAWLSDSSAVSVGYGYRFARYFQADIGLDVLFGAARVREFLLTDIGDFRIKDREYFLPMGGRAIAPLFGGRLLFSGGGPPSCATPSGSTSPAATSAWTARFAPRAAAGGTTRRQT
jgi:hypothetical protein